MSRIDDLDAAISESQPDALDAAVSAVTSENTASRRGALLQATERNPDEFAEAKQLGRVLQLPAGVVTGSLPELKRRMKLDEIDAAIADSPVLARKLQERDFASLVHDDVEVAKRAEQAANFKPTINGADVSMLIDEAMKHNPALDWDTARANVLKKYNVDNTSTGLLRVPQQPTLTPASFVRGLFVNAKNLIPKLRESARMQFAGNVGLQDMEADAQRRYSQLVSAESLVTPEFGKGDTLARYTYGGAQSVLTNVPGLTLAVLTRNPYVALLPAVGQTELDQYARTRTRGSTVGEANLAGVLAGTIEGATELWPMKFLVDSIGKRTLMQLVVGDQIREQFGEQIATHMQDAVDTAIANPTKTWGEYWKERPDAAMQTVVAVLMQSAVVATAGYAANSTAGKTNAAIKADQYAQNFLRLAQIAEASKIRSRDAESFQQFVASVAEESPVQEVWVNPNTLAQSGVDLQVLAQVSPSFAAQLDSALQTGGEVRIPVAEFATALPGTGFEQSVLPHLRTDPDTMTQAEAQVFMQSQMEEFQRESATMLAKVEERSAFDTSAQVVEDSILSQLKTANRFTEDVNREYAKLARAVFSSAAARMRVTPEDAYKQFALQVRAQQIAAQYDQQTGQLRTETPEFKAWFGDSKVVDAEGKPLVVYHGTRNPPTAFSESRIGSASTVLGNYEVERYGVFAAEDPDLSGEYATQGEARPGSTTMPLYLRAESPLDTLRVDYTNELFAAVEKAAEGLGAPNGYHAARMLGDRWGRGTLWTLFDVDEGNDPKFWIDLFKSLGYDSLRIEERSEGEVANTASWVVFSPEQIKSVFNRGTWNPNDPNILNQSPLEGMTEEEQGVTLVDWLFGNRPPFTTATRVRELGELLVEMSPKAHAEYTEENKAFIAGVMVKELDAAFKSGKAVTDWYEHNIQQMHDIVALEFPEVATDPEARFAFDYILAVLSNGQTVSANFKNAMRFYERYRTEKLMPSVDSTYGVRHAQMAQAFQLYNIAKNEVGIEVFREFMLSKHPVVTLNGMRTSPVRERVDQEVYGGTIIGSKIGGAFLQNISGNHDALTMDTWWMRTWGRLTGTLLASKYDPSDHSDTGLKDSTDSGAHKAFMRETAAEALSQLRKMGYTDLQMDGLQATYWYMEKELYAINGNADADVEGTDYGTEAARHAAKNGYAENALVAEVLRNAQLPLGRGGRGADGRAREGGRADQVFNQEGLSYGPLGRQLSPDQDNLSTVGGRSPDRGWRDATRVRRANGEPAAVSRGASEELRADHFQLGYLGRASGNPSSGLGVWFTYDFAEATRYGATVENFFLDLRNPLVLKEAPPGFESVEEAHRWRESLRAKGHDGIVLDYRPLGGPVHFVAFDPHQVIRENPLPSLDFTTFFQSSVQQPTVLSSRITSLDEFDTNMPSFLRKDGWLIITATTSGDPYSEANVAANRTLEEDLKARGLSYRAGEGFYLKAPQGTSFLVQGDEALGIELAKKYKQESVLTKDGYVYQDGSLTPVDHTKDTFGEEAKQQDGYTVIGDKAFSLGLDFSQRVDKADRVNPALPFAVNGVRAIHYSKSERSTLDGHRFGEGLTGAERERLRDADPRLRVRTAFYVSNGEGVTPEAGVGTVAHLSTLNNLYDADADALHIWDKHRDANARELAVIEAGYAGYLGRDAFDRQGAAVVFGRTDLPTAKVEDPNAVAEVPPPPKISEVQRVRRALATSRRYPAGQMPREVWGEYVKQIDPDAYRALSPFGIFEGKDVVYRDELLRSVMDQPAYHGTKVKGIKKFSTEFIGTGEGAQAYGWGLYFAGDRAIAEFYREMLTGDPVPIKTFYLGARPVVRNSEYIDYSPRQGHDRNRENVWATLAEGLLVDERAVREAAEKGRLTEHVLSELDGLIARYESEWPEVVPAAKGLRSTLARPGAIRFELEPAEQGQVYKVELPEHDEFLDWDKPLSEQSEKVKTALKGTDYEIGPSTKEIERRASDLLDRDAADWADESGGDPIDFSNNADFEDYIQRAKDELGGIDSDLRGADLYRLIVRDEGGRDNLFDDPMQYEESASRYLNSLGIPGIRYLDAGSRSKGEGTHNYVVFDDNAIRILEEYYQEEKTPRGQISFGTDITQQPSVISLLQQADLTTFIHELGHFQLEVLSAMAARGEATAQQDMQTLLGWFGVPDLATWNGMSLEEKRPYHEQFARGFEAYTLEGKAPSIELQSTFARVRAWMLNIYKNLTQLNVQLTDEVRGVFDRMLATEQQIAEAETQRSYGALFMSAAAAGMSPEEWTAYQSLGAQATEDATAELQARSLRNMQWITNAKSRALKALQKDATAKRKAVEAEVREEVRRQPVYAARRFLAYGELGPEVLFSKGEELAGKLDLGALKEMYGEGPAALWRYLPTGEKGLAASEGLHPDTVAEMFGFTSGDQLVRELIGAEQESSVIEGMTDQRMLERYGDLATPEAIERAAEKAIHNEARAKFIATELNALARATGRSKVLLPAAREFAARTVARQLIRLLKPTQYAAAEARAAKAAMTALKAGNTNEAAVEKRNQLVNNLTAKAANEAAADIESGIIYLKKFDREGTRSKIDIDYLDQIDAILERFDLRTGQSLRAIDKRKSLADWITKQEEMGLEPAIPDSLRNEAFRKHFKDLTVEEFRGLVDAVKNIEHLGRLKTKLLTAVRQREFATAVEEIVTSIKANAKGTVAERRSSDRGNLVDVAQLARNFLADHRKFASLAREMDGWQDGGVMWEYLVRGMNAAGDKEASMREAATVKLSELLKPILKEGGMGKKTFFPQIGKSFTREERIGIALNMGNEVNRERVATGEKLSPVQLQAILDTLTKPEWDFVQGVLNFFESYRPQIAEKERRLTGVEPEWVQATPIMTKFGEYPGGYYPIAYDPLRSSRAEADTAAEVQRQIERGLYVQAQTRRGHLKARTESTGRPLRYDLGVIVKHVDQVVHDLAWHEFLIDANRLLRNGRVDSAIREHYGPEKLATMKDALRDIAIGDMAAQGSLDRILNHLRHGATIVGLGWRVTTSLLQPLGLTQSIVRVGPQWVAKGLRHWAGDSVRLENSARLIGEKSEFMRLRAKTLQREINEIRNRVRGKDSVVEASYFYLIQKMQLIADVPTWWGAYEKAMASEDNEARAVALADQAVIDAQGAGQIKDLSAVQRGGAGWKLFTTFYSFFNTTYNLTAEAFGRASVKRPASIGLLAVDLLLLYTVPAVLGTLMKAVLAGDWDDEERLRRKLLADQISYATGTMMLVREAGGIAQNVIDPQHAFDYTGPASLRFFASVSKLAKQVGQGEADEAFWKALNETAGTIFHYPAGQINATVDGINAIADGKTENPGALLVGHKDR